jgi:putative nucleotidyltransferase with HDIG domain
MSSSSPIGKGSKPTRLHHWDGRRRSTRGEPPLVRLGESVWQGKLWIILATTVAATLLCTFAGPWSRYRAGEVCRHDVRTRVAFACPLSFVLCPELEGSTVRGPAPQPAACTPRGSGQRTKDKGQTVTVHYPPGFLVVRRGQPITEDQELILDAEAQAFRNHFTLGDYCHRGLSLSLIFGLLAVLSVLYVARFQPDLANHTGKIFSVCAVGLLTLGVAALITGVSWHLVLVPLTVASLVLTIGFNPRFALVMALNLTLAVTLCARRPPSDLLVALGSQTTAILCLRSVRTRSRLAEVGGLAGLAGLIATIATGLYTGQTWYLIALDGGAAFLWGTLAGLIVTGLLPLVERCFHIVTDVRLLELGDGSHPLLQELVRRAPGTYTHSMTVATLAEAAAESIAANPLLARVGSYFHDIGKMLKPQYFIENQTGENRHDTLEPALSTLIITGHVKDGLALGEEYRLPPAILDFIAQHHGTTLVEYFYRQALRNQEQAGARRSLSADQPNPLEACFRYPGPKPGTPENAIVMLADAVESASRALNTPTPGSLRKLVHDLLMKRLLDGQFEDSGLTLSELHRIEESLCKGLHALFHARIQYPEPEWRRAA